MAGSNELAEVGRGEIRPEVVELLCQLRGEPALTTEEIASAIGLSKPMVRQRLEELDRRGELESKRFGCGAYTWWPTPE